MNAAEHVIQKCGGPQVVAEWVGLALGSVYKWTYPKPRGRNGIIPAKYQCILLDRAKSEGIKLTPADFFYRSDHGKTA